MNLQELLHDQRLADKTAETEILVKKWKNTGLLEGLNSQKAVIIACLLENQALNLKRELLTETTATSTSAGMESWSNVALPLVRRIFANLIANEIVAVQPMTLPSGLVFYLDFKYHDANHPSGSTTHDPNFPSNAMSLYGNTSTSAVSGANMGGFYGGLNFSYTQNYITGSTVTASYTAAAGTGTSSDAAAVTFTFNDIERNDNLSASFAAGRLSRLCIMSGALPSLDITEIKPLSVTDTGISMVYRSFTTYDATNGRIYLVVSGSTTGQNLTTVSYIRKTQETFRGDFEQGQTQIQDIPEIDLEIRSVPVAAKTRKLKAIWTPEMQQDIAAYHNVDVEAELTTILSETVGLEIDREIIRQLLDEAVTRTWWSRNNGTFVNSSGNTITGTGTIYGTQQEWYQTLVETILEVSNQIYKRTLRGRANWIVTSPEISSILESTNTFRSDKVMEGTDTKLNLGIEKTGVLSNRWSVYIDPYFPNNKILIGYKGNSFLETGFVYCPYVPFVLTPTILDPTNFVPRKGILTRYGKVMIRPEFYGVITVRDMRFIA